MTAAARLAAADADDIAIAGRLFAEIAAMTPDSEGVSRPAFSEIETRTLAFLEAFAREHGLECWYDEGLNANFCLPGDRDAAGIVVVGSHVDSVPFGGNYDGLAGVVSGLLCLLRAHRAGARFATPVHVLAMRGEESAWFGPCYIGSKVLTGTLAAPELAAKHRGDGRTLGQHMAEIGLPMSREAAACPPSIEKMARATCSSGSSPAISRAAASLRADGTWSAGPSTSPMRSWPSAARTGPRLTENRSARADSCRRSPDL